jgi:cholesterol transport system auxiliary component
MKAGALLLALAAAITPGCALMTHAQVETHKQVLAKVPSDIPQGRALGATLLVLLPEGKAVYDTTEMAYTLKPYQVEYFSRNEWGERPSQMLHALLVKTLRGTGQFKEVLASPHIGPHKYALRSEILELQQDFTTDTPTLRLAMRVQLVDGASQKIIASRELHASEPMREKSPYAGVVAANDAAARILRDIARFVIETAG